MSIHHYKSDIIGGIISALVSLPLALACGLLLFSGFPELQQFGINAAFYTAIIGTLVTLFISNHSLQIGGPLVVTALILSDFLISVSSKIQVLNPDILTLIFSLMFVCVIVTGLIQLIFAYFKIGNLIKFLPSSVTKGISTTIGIIIIVKQLPIVFNVESKNISETALLIFITVIMLSLLLLKNFNSIKELVNKRLPFNIFVYLPIIVPILGGIIFFLFSSNSNLMLGNVKVELPNLNYNYESFLQSLTLIKAFLPEIFLTSFAIALMSSLSSLLSVNLLNNKPEIKSSKNNTSYELYGQGLGNILSGLFGGMPSAGTEARSLVNFEAGGRTRLSVVVNVITIFLFIFIFNDYLTYIPVIILSTMLIFTGIVMSMPTFFMVKKLYKNCSNNTKKQNCIKDVFYSFMIILVMLITAFISDITIAIVFGFAFASLLFIYETMKNSNFNILNRTMIQSKRERTTKAREFLQKNGKEISIIELDGSIFFGTADILRKTINSIDSKYIILDFKKVTEIDITGADIIKQVIDENKIDSKKSFIFSHIRFGDDTYEALCSADIIMPEVENWYEYTDLALEFAENRLLKENDIVESKYNQIIDLDSMSVARNLNKDEQKILLGYLDEKKFSKDEYLYKENDESDCIYFLRNGSVTVWDEHEEYFYENSTTSKTRRVTYSAGVVVGQMAFFEEKKQSVEAVADCDISTYVLTRVKFDKLLKEYPLVAQDLLLEFCKHLSRRLREITYEVQVLERWQ
ncbi:SulP family inorganic anion transporter [Arcobacter arenosus]|uniref:Cyclic nucleotide-binding domain-containing protein n=1 Tax=Arcobacter arenosus TaxID=2576037 RepID=A0A5R8XXD8_9BACT|nr:SulP family inorganic anion transporter [Arcobacter arenosus]TLP35501.1 cyclic nucleotide-binding domain-containing protein [Arcobacter arenosus]